MTSASGKQRIFVAGHRGMVGQAICRALAKSANCELVTRDRAALDLTDQSAVRNFFSCEPVSQIYICAAKVGGIYANSTYPAEFIYQNLMIEANLVHEAWAAGIEKLLFLGSSCIYPRLAEQPIDETSLLSGALEPTNEPYAVAKIAGIKLCESYSRQYGVDYRSAMPTNLYGPGDNYHPENSHVIPGLIRRFAEARRDGIAKVVVWGKGTPRREFLHVDDAADACVHIMTIGRDAYESLTEPMLRHVNVGTGTDVSIRQLAAMIAEATGYTGEVAFDDSKPDGPPRKLLNVAKLKALGWTSSINLKAGLASAVNDFEKMNNDQAENA